MPAWSPSGGLYVSCFACGGVADATVVLYGVSHEAPIQLERGVCAVDLLGLLALKLPMWWSEHEALFQVALVQNLFQETAFAKGPGEEST
jgi:hypothetical protein